MTATPTPPPVEPAAPATTAASTTAPGPTAPGPTVPTPTVPYGPPVTESDAGVPEAAITLDLSNRSVANTAGKWAIRILLPLLIRAIFRAIARR